MESTFRVNEMDTTLSDLQIQKLNQMLVFISQYNEFYKDRLKHVLLPIRSKEDLQQLPFTCKYELVQDQTNFSPLGRNHTFSKAEYVRYHQTSGTTGKPLKVLDTKESWTWWEDCWLEVFKSSDVTKNDIAFSAFSFGPFIGFWAAFEAAKRLGALVITGGSQSSKERLQSMINNEATVLLCTPSYALHLAEVAEENSIDLRETNIKTIITAGEPGGSVPSIRQQIERLWNAKLYDHVGMTEIGAYGYSCTEQNGLHVNEAEFIVEVINPDTLEPVGKRERGELVLTNLGRYGYPLLRYRTGDMVICSEEPCPCGNKNTLLVNGIIGRLDDMVIIRGINIFPSSIESIIREFEAVKEFRIIYYTEQNMNQVKVQIEAEADLVTQVATKLRDRIGLRIDVEMVAENSLPRFDLKAKRVVDERAVN
ncbi:phenylacetate--CoA ligase family protein [Metabacillus niabensis]|uniref:phenylacetate--CoA ligase family protein n=1 Tax=Metabacillus niabensis TaxID=324854 RepID=UPI001CFA7B9E|nr:AMP-binding protein [Metabacillus niabensis]